MLSKTLFGRFLWIKLYNIILIDSIIQINSFIIISSLWASSSDIDSWHLRHTHAVCHSHSDQIFPLVQTIYKISFRRSNEPIHYETLMKMDFKDALSLC